MMNNNHQQEQEQLQDQQVDHYLIQQQQVVSIEHPLAENTDGDIAIVNTSVPYERKRSKTRLIIGLLLLVLLLAVIGISIGVSMSNTGSSDNTNISSSSTSTMNSDNDNSDNSDNTISSEATFEGTGTTGSIPSGNGGNDNNDIYVGTDNSDISGGNSDINNDGSINDDNINNSDNMNINDQFTPTSVGNNNENEEEIEDELLTLLRGHSVAGGNEFNDVNSYQYQAYLWLSQTFDPVLHNSLERILQRYALACIFYATNGVRTAWTDREYNNLEDVPGWITSTGWLQYEDECTWYQIFCNDDKRVTQIELYSNRMTGSFPIEVILLKDTLETIDIYNNMLYNVGSEGNDFLGELTNLKKLFYSSTSFQYDGIPPAIGRLTNLVEYDCSFTLYHGALNGQVFQNLNELEYLYIGGNSFHSAIPDELAQLPKLQFFYADYTDLTGDINFLTQMPSIIELWIDNNPNLMGATIPNDIGSAPLSTTLRSLSLTGCELSGTIPPSLGDLTHLQQAWLYGNNFHSTIPTELGKLVHLTRIGFENNDLTGTMPLEVCANREPIGLINKLDSDCAEGQGVDCSCCTCCGSGCSGIM